MKVLASSPGPFQLFNVALLDPFFQHANMKSWNVPVDEVMKAQLVNSLLLLMPTLGGGSL